MTDWWRNKGEVAEFRERVLEVREQIRAIVQEIGADGQVKKLSATRYNTVAAALKKFSPAAAAVDAYIADGEYGIESFIGEVGRGFVAAQQELDAGSRRYLTSKPEHAHPAAYKIPKLSAEMKVGIQSAVKGKLNFLLYSSSKERRSEQQHTVSFDIVAAPPPHDLMDAAEGVALRDAVVTNLLQREWIRTRLEAFHMRPTGPMSAKLVEVHERVGAVLEAYSRVLAIRGDTAFLLVIPEASLPRLALPFDTDLDPFIENATGILKELSERQAAELKARSTQVERIRAGIPETPQ